MKKILFLIAVLLLPAALLHAQGNWGLDAGMQAPDFEALNHRNETVRLSEVNSKGPVLLIFYRGGWCPYCNRHLKAFNDRLNDFKQLGVTILALSVDTPGNAAKSVVEDNLGFDIISNPDTSILDLYNLTYKVAEGLVKKYKEEYKIDLEAASGEDHHIIAVPAVFIINSDGKIVYSYANEDYKIRKNPEEILMILREGALDDPAQYKKIEQIKRYILGFGPWAFWVYVLLYMLNTITLIPPILFMTLAGGALFGPLWGGLAVLIGCMTGTTATFFISRLLGKRFVDRIVKGKVLEFENKLNKQGFWAILVVRLVAFPPWEVVNYISGLTKIKFRDFFWGTFFGIIPAIIVQVYLADRAVAFDIKDPKVILQLVLAVALFVLLGFTPKIVDKIRKARS